MVDCSRALCAIIRPSNFVHPVTVPLPTETGLRSSNMVLPASCIRYIRKVPEYDQGGGSVLRPRLPQGWEYFRRHREKPHGEQREIEVGTRQAADVIVLLLEAHFTAEHPITTVSLHLVRVAPSKKNPFEGRMIWLLCVFLPNLLLSTYNCCLLDEEITTTT